MIVNILPNKCDSFALKHTFKPWQIGLLEGALSKESSDQVITVNMGSKAGHTYFAKILASSEFPVRTKIYVASQRYLSEYSKLLFDDTKVHESIGFLDDKNFQGYRGDPIKIVVIDMGGESPNTFRSKLESLTNSAFQAKILLLQAKLSI